MHGTERDQGGASAQADLLSRSILELRQLKLRLQKVEQDRTEPVAIIGMACRLPGADDPDSYWELLREGRSTAREMPDDRWDWAAHYDPDPQAFGKTHVRRANYIDGVDRFDAAFFGITPREAAAIDPQQRLLLETGWRALEHAGIVWSELAGSRTGVFVGITAMEYLQLQLMRGDPRQVDGYVLTGGSLSFAAGRISYSLGLQGPAMAVDSACSSALVALHLACQSLRDGSSDLALAGGVNLMLSPEMNIINSRMRTLSADGTCKTFDAAADGYGRGEGCVVLVLKRLSAAIADGDRIEAVVRGSAVNQDGASSGLTVPNGLAQQSLIRQALKNANARPDEISYVDAHGTGTSLGDPIEVSALGEVFGNGPERLKPLIVGSSKTNIGHLESAAGLASVLKVVLSLKHRQIPAHLHLTSPNPHIPWNSLPIEVPTKLSPWPENGLPRLAGVSSFGASGINAHAVLQEAPEQLLPARNSRDRPIHLLTLSAKSAGALQTLAGNYLAFSQRQALPDFADACCTAATGRSHHGERMAVAAKDWDQLRDRLAGFLSGQARPGLQSGSVQQARPPKIAFLFTGEDAHHFATGKELYEKLPVFRAELERCDALLRRHLDVPLLSALHDERHCHVLNQPAFAQPAMFALDYALVQLWKGWGIEPDMLLGHGLGEYAAACTAGIFSLEDGLALAAARGRVRGASSGKRDLALHDFEQVAQRIRYVQQPRTRIASSTTGAMGMPSELSTAAYWRKNLLAPIQSTQGTQALLEHGASIFLEFGPRQTTPDSTRAAASERGVRFLPSPVQQGDAWDRITDSLGALYVHGAPVDWVAFERPFPRRRIALPTYPFEPHRHWFAPSTTPAASPASSLQPLLAKRIKAPEQDGMVFAAMLDPATLPLLRDHQVYGALVVTGVFHLALVHSAIEQVHPGRRPASCEDLVFHTPMVIPKDAATQVRVVLHDADDGVVSFACHASVVPSTIDEAPLVEEWKLHTTGRYRLAERTAPAPTSCPSLAIDDVRSRCRAEWSRDRFYRLWREDEHYVGPGFRLVDHVLRRDGEALGRVSRPEHLAPDAGDGSGKWPAEGIEEACVAEAAGQIARAAFSRPNEINAAFLAVGMRHWVRVAGPLCEVAWLHARIVSESVDEVVADVLLLDEAGKVLGSAGGLQFRRVEKVVLARAVERYSAGLVKSRCQWDRVAFDRADAHQRPRLVLAWVGEQLAEICGLTLSVREQNASLRALGMDSLMAADLKDRFASDLGIDVPAADLLLGPTTSALAHHLLLRLSGDASSLRETTALADQEPTCGDGPGSFSHAAGTAGKWLRCPRPQPNASVRLFCFPYGGAGASLFRSWAEALPSWIEMCAIQLPGREDRMLDMMCTDLAALQDELLAVLSAQLDRPYVFFGSSLGGLLSYRMASALEQTEAPGPLAVFAAAFPAPHLASQLLSGIMPLLTDESAAGRARFLADVRRLGLMSDAMLENREFSNALLPLLRSDLALVQSSERLPTSPLRCPLCVFGGNRDPFVDRDMLASWSTYTTSSFRMETVPGGHNFMDESRQPLLDDITHELRRLLGSQKSTAAWPS